MKKASILLFAFVLSIFTISCSDDDNKLSSNIAYFEENNITLTNEVTPITIDFTKPANTAGNVTLGYVVNGIIYGTDFTTTPAADNNNKIVLPFEKGATSVSFDFNKLVEAIEGETKNVTFTIENISVNNIVTANNNSIQLNFTQTAATTGIITPTVGGPNQPNQVYIDLSSGSQTSVRRDTWDFGFYSGDDFRVIINGSVKMAVKQLNTTNIDEIQSIDEAVTVSYSTLSSSGYVDNPTGILEGNGNGIGTAIAEISANNEENKVYLVNLGFEIATATPNTGSVLTDGDYRGWKKVRITRDGNDYKIQFADLNATTHQTATISKNPAYNFSYFSIVNNQLANVEPAKTNWDINFTTFTNYFSFGADEITYFYADFITTNLHGGTTAYQVMNSDVTYEAFTMANVDNSKFNESATDQRVIGDKWRSGGGPTSAPSIRDDRFYVIKDPAGNIYKLKFLALTNQAGERGNPVFQYELL